jgi:5,10-methylenetetrahydromethanopterin reductase
VVFNSLWSTQAVERSVKMVRQGAEEAGRDPASVRIWTIVVTACDTTEENYLNWVIRRMNTYLMFPPMMEKVCEMNGWDYQKAKELLQALKEIDKDTSGDTVGDEKTSRDINDLRKMEALYPRHWITEGNAVGNAETCAKAVADRFAAGADSVLFHGSHPRALKSLMEVWPKYRPDFKKTPAVNPGLWA